MIKEPLEHLTRVAVLSGRNVSRANLAPDLLLRVRLITLHNLFEVADGLGQTTLSSGDAAQLVVCIQLFRVDVDRTLKTLARQIHFTALLMYQTKIVMRR